MAPQAGLEPATLRLTAGCSAIELLRNTDRTKNRSDRPSIVANQLILAQHDHRNDACRQACRQKNWPPRYNCHQNDDTVEAAGSAGRTSNNCDASHVIIANAIARPAATVRPSPCDDTSRSTGRRSCARAPSGCRSPAAALGEVSGDSLPDECREKSIFDGSA